MWATKGRVESVGYPNEGGGGANNHVVYYCIYFIIILGLRLIDIYIYIYIYTYTYILWNFWRYGYK